MKKAKVLFYLISYILIVVFSIFGLILNIWTLAINEQMLHAEKIIKQYKEKSKALELYLIQRKSVENLEKIASEQLNLVHPKQIHYIWIKE